MAVHLDPLHQRLAEIGAAPSVGRVGDSYDNSLAESTIGLYKTELTRRQEYSQAFAVPDRRV